MCHRLPEFGEPSDETNPLGRLTPDLMHKAELGALLSRFAGIHEFTQTFPHLSLSKENIEAQQNFVLQNYKLDIEMLQKLQGKEVLDNIELQSIESLEKDMDDLRQKGKWLQQAHNEFDIFNAAKESIESHYGNNRH
ncbi:MAG: hypothetical protein V4469_04245 [Patescibacteria group bacterium]